MSKVIHSFLGREPVGDEATIAEEDWSNILELGEKFRINILTGESSNDDAYSLAILAEHASNSLADVHRYTYLRSNIYFDGYYGLRINLPDSFVMSFVKLDEAAHEFERRMIAPTLSDVFQVLVTSSNEILRRLRTPEMSLHREFVKIFSDRGSRIGFDGSCFLEASLGMISESAFFDAVERIIEGFEDTHDPETKAWIRAIGLTVEDFLAMADEARAQVMVYRILQEGAARG